MKGLLAIISLPGKAVWDKILQFEILFIFIYIYMKLRNIPCITPRRNANKMSLILSTEQKNSLPCGVSDVRSNWMKSKKGKCQGFSKLYRNGWRHWLLRGISRIYGGKLYPSPLLFPTCLFHICLINLWLFD